MLDISARRLGPFGEHRLNRLRHTVLMEGRAGAPHLRNERRLTRRESGT